MDCCMVSSPQASSETDVKNHVKALLYTDSDFTICSLMAMLKVQSCQIAAMMPSEMLRWSF